MMLSEWNELTGLTWSVDDYRIIEFVYMYHPAFNCPEPKQKALQTWKMFGMLGFLDMYQTALIQRKYEQDMEHATNDYNERCKNIETEYEYSMYNRGYYKK